MLHTQACDWANVASALQLIGLKCALALDIGVQHP